MTGSNRALASDPSISGVSIEALKHWSIGKGPTNHFHHGSSVAAKLSQTWFLACRRSPRRKRHWRTAAFRVRRWAPQNLSLLPAAKFGSFTGEKLCFNMFHPQKPEMHMVQLVFSFFAEEHGGLWGGCSNIPVGRCDQKSMAILVW